MGSVSSLNMSTKNSENIYRLANRVDLYLTCKLLLGFDIAVSNSLDSVYIFIAYANKVMVNYVRFVSVPLLASADDDYGTIVCFSILIKLKKII